MHPRTAGAPARRSFSALLLVSLAAGALAACAGGPPPRSSLPATSPTGAPPNGSVSNAAQSGPTRSAAAAVQRATDQVVTTERAFARTMADRNFKAFLGYLSPDAVFFSGRTIERGQAEIAAVWEPYFNGRTAPFSWEPDHVEVLPDGRLALSTGPLIEHGQVVGRFDSVWRLEAPNTWRIVFDKGEPVCGAPGAAPTGAGAPSAPSDNGVQIIETQ